MWIVSSFHLCDFQTVVVSSKAQDLTEDHTFVSGWSAQTTTETINKQQQNVNNKESN